MPKATTTHLPSPGLRDFIGALNEQRPDVERQVRLFAVGARHAVAEFEDQVAPLDLSTVATTYKLEDAGPHPNPAKAETARGSTGSRSIL